MGDAAAADDAAASGGRSRSMPPPLDMSEGILYVDHGKRLRERPVSPVASVDSSWRYRRIRQKARMKDRSSRNRRKEQEEQEEEEEEEDGEERKKKKPSSSSARSKSCDSDNVGTAIVPFACGGGGWQQRR